ncbi:MAG: hypothetical protein R3E95_14480 [Thiolinea sp.]
MSIPALLGRVRQCFETLPEHRQRGRVDYPLADALMSAVAMFSLKDATLYAFDELRNDPVRQHNLRQLYGIQQAPCDTQMRSILDQVEPYALRPAFVLVHQELQKQGVLETYRFMGKYLISVDGTGLYSSSHVSCPECCCKQHRNGEESYYHQLLGAVLVHPDQSTVLPLFPEAITRRDGSEKNDCEHNASQRLLPAVRQAFPRLEMTVLQDALACNGPHIRNLKAQRFSFIITSKPRSNSLLLNTVLAGLDDGSTPEFEQTDEQGVIRGYRFRNDAPLNHEHADLKVTFIDHREKHPNGKTFCMPASPDLPSPPTTWRRSCARAVRAGKIENETFNTLKIKAITLNTTTVMARNTVNRIRHPDDADLPDRPVGSLLPLLSEAWHSFRTRKFLWERIQLSFCLSLIDSWESRTPPSFGGLIRQRPRSGRIPASNATGDQRLDGC